MNLQEQYTRAIQLVKSTFAGVADRGGNPYTNHLMAVMNGVETEKEKIVAILHDIIEDTSIKPIDLVEAGFDTEVVDAVVCLTKDKDEDYFDYIRKVKTNKIAINVKKADLLHNMKLDRLKKITLKDIERNRKYLNAFEILIKE